MKLYYYKRLKGNFGDDLNPWLWPCLLPEILDDDDSCLFVGIGTLLNHRLPSDKKLIIIGTGAGLGPPPTITENWHIYGVRGPVTASALGLPSHLALTDPAMAVRDYFLPRPQSRSRIGFMPHYESLRHWDWQKTAGELGLEFVDPCSPIDVVMTKVAGLEKLVTEAMHGAIVADALRTPWVGVSLDPEFYEAKWADWGQSIKLIPRIHKISPLFDLGRNQLLSARAKNRLKRLLIQLGAASPSWTEPYQPKSSATDIAISMHQLRQVADQAEPQLSADMALDAALDRFYTAVSDFRRDWAQGDFARARVAC